MKNLNFVATFKSLTLILVLFVFGSLITLGQSTPVTTASPTPTPVAVVKPATDAIPIWKTIKIGKKDSADLLAALKGVYVSDNAKELISRVSPPTTSLEETSVNLVLISASKLGLKGDEITLTQIIEAAGKVGLKICPPELGPYLRYQYTDQPSGERIFVAMDPLDYKDQKRIFTLDESGNKAWLYTIYGFPSLTPNVEVWSPDFKWVFVRQP